MRRIMIMVVALAAVLALSGTAIAATGWTAPARLSSLDVSRQPDGPSIAQRDGKRYVAITADGIVLLADHNGTWQRTRLTTDRTTPGNIKVDTDPSLAIDGNGKLHVAFTRNTGGDCGTIGCGPDQLMYATNKTGHWVITGLLGGPWLPSLALTASGWPRIASVHVGQAEAALNLSVLGPHGWSIVTINTDPDRDLGGQSLAIRGDRAFVAYRQPLTPTTGQLRLAEVVGKTVVQRSTISYSPTAHDPAMVVLGAGQPAVTYLDDGGLWYAARDTHGAWSHTSIASGLKSDLVPSIALVGSAHVAIVAQRNNRPQATRGSGDILFLTDRSGSWTSRLLTHLATDRYPADRLPDIATSHNGKAWVVFIRETGPTNRTDTLWQTREQ